MYGLFTYMKGDFHGHMNKKKCLGTPLKTNMTTENPHF